MAELEPLADFPAIVSNVRSLVDKGIRIQFDLPETETAMLAVLHGLQRDDRVLRIIIYDDDDFQKALITRNKQA